MHVQARLARRSRRHPVSKTGIETGLRDVDRNRSTCPGAHCTAHRSQRVPKILTLSHRNPVTRISMNPRRTRARSQGFPKNLTLLRKTAFQRRRKLLPKTLTVTAAVSKLSMTSDTYVHQVVGIARRSPPEKSHLYGIPADAAAARRLLKNLTCAKKWHSENRISASPGGRFSEFSPLRVPESLTCDQIASKQRSRKTSPVRRPTTCDRYPEKAHLIGIRAGKPGFCSRKSSPFGPHRRHQALFFVQNDLRFPEILTANPCGVP